MIACSSIMLYTSKAIISSGRVAMSLIRNNEVTNLRGASTHTHRHLSLATWGIFIHQRVVMILVPHTQPVGPSLCIYFWSLNETNIFVMTITHLVHLGIFELFVYCLCGIAGDPWSKPNSDPFFQFLL